MARGGFQGILNFIREGREREQNRADIESLAPALLDALGVNPTQDLPFNEETFFNERPVSRGTDIGQILETDILEDGQPPPEFTGVDKRQGQRGTLTFNPEQRKAFGRFLSRNPEKASQIIINTLEKTNTNQQLQLKKNITDITKDSQFLKGAKNPLEMLGRIRQLAAEPNISPARKAELRTILNNPEFEGKQLLIEKNILDGRDLEKVFSEEETKRQETAKTLEARRAEAAKIVETKRVEAVKATEATGQRGAFVDVKDSLGNIMGSRNTITNEFKPIDTSFFAKPKLDNFTQKSVQKYIKSKNPGDLVAVDEGPSDQILSAFIPFMFGGVDFEDPQEMAQAFSRFNMIGAGLSNKSPEEMQALAKKIEALRPKIEEEPEEPGTIEQIGKILKEIFPGNAPQGISEIPLAKPATSTPEPLKKLPATTGEPTSSLEEAKNAIPGVQVDENGFFYLPNPKAPGGKQFIKNERGKSGQRIKVK